MMLTYDYVCAAIDAMTNGQTSGSSSTQTSAIKSIAILGASGNIGVEVVKALLSQPSSPHVTVLTRKSSASKTEAQFASFENARGNLSVCPVESYTSHDALVQAFKGQDCVISTLASFSAKQQKATIDAAIAAGVQRFFPSEFGVDSSDRAAVAEHLPILLMKREIVEYLESKQDQISWTAVITGAFFDWALKLPGVLAFNLHESKVVVYDKGEVPYEATNVGQIGRAVAACISTPELVQKTKNQYVYVNSFTVTQNQVLDLLRKYMGGKSLEVTHASSREELETSKQILAASDISWRDFEPTPEKPYVDGSIPMIWSAIFGNTGLNQYSKTRGLWNDVLGLPMENLEQTIQGVVEELGLRA